MTDSPPASIRILVADDHPVVRDGLVTVLGTQPDFLIVGEAANGLEAVEKAETLRPDVILLDLEMPGIDGVEAIRRIHAANTAQILVFTAFDTDELIIGAVQAGANGYLLKGAPRSEIFNAIRVVSQGGSLLQPIVASRLMQHINHQTEESNGQALQALTEREMEVLQWLAQGKLNKEIAVGLVISERTVKFHISSILSKLGAGNRTEAVSIAAQRGLINFSG
ncbi:MAG: response regulator transcription factor [Chloroflexota bacterium]